MAVYPCSFYPHRYPQRQRSIYISDVNSERPQTRKHRVCPKHLDQLLEVLKGSFTFIDEDTMTSLACEVCEAPRESAVYVKVFSEDGHEPGAWGADLCAQHRLDALQALGWHDALPVGARDRL